MGYAVYMSRLSFTKTDDQGIPTAEPEVVEKGGRVPDYVRPFEITSLRAAGMIVDMGDDREQRDDTPRFAELPPALPNPEVPPTVAGNRFLPGLDTGPDDLPGPDDPQAEPTGLEREQAAGFNKEAASGSDQAAREREERERRERQAGTTAPTGQPAEKPKPTDTKEAWEDYAASPAVGMDRAEAESMTKPKLMAEVNRRESAQ